MDERPAQDSGATAHIGASLVAHALVLLFASFTMPASGEAPSSAADEETAYVVHQALAAAAEREDEPPRATETAVDVPDEIDPTHSRCGELHGGTMGEPTARVVGNRYGVEGDADNPDPHIAERSSLSATSAQLTVSSIGVPQSGDNRGPTAVWGREDALGNDALAARGAMWGEEIGDAFGSPGTGIGRHDLCPLCGDYGAGASLVRKTLPGGASETERAFYR